MPEILRRGLAGITYVLLVMLLIALTAPRLAAARARHCAYARTSVAAATRTEIRDAVLCLVNRQRASRDLPRLREDTRLDRSAQGWTATMVRLGRLTHGTGIGLRFDAVGFLWAALGENIGSGFETPRQVVRGWMASLDHCQNILWPAYTRIGTGVLNRGVGGDGPATWTADFGRPQGTQAPSDNYRPERGCPYR